MLSTGIRRGEGAVLVRYEGNYTTRLVTVMGDRAALSGWKCLSLISSTSHVNAKLRKIKTLPSEFASDAEFIRRVYLDMTGLPPTIGEGSRVFWRTQSDAESQTRQID